MARSRTARDPVSLGPVHRLRRVACGGHSANVKHVAIAPSQPQTVYAATSAGGVWRSDDGGATWSLPGDEMASRSVRWLSVDPADPKSVWAGIEARGSGSALWRTTDGGATWKPVADAYPGGRVQATGAPITFAPTQPKTIYVASTNLHYRTDDGGKTWRDFRVPNQGAYVFAVHPQRPKIVFAGGRGETQNLSRSTTAARPGARSASASARTASTSWSSTQPNRPRSTPRVGRSRRSSRAPTTATAGASSAPVGGTSNLYSLTIDPKNGQQLWAATEDGLLKSADGGATWDPRQWRIPPATWSSRSQSTRATA